uniref:hypothetical protein n=1 Tax=Enterocloster clostridioformis TaxID=1531 RepID=UPI000A81E554|nr:hypothetical protein [Enterocloster clostridioformis]
MDVASKQQKTLRNVLYYGLPVLAILMIAVGWVLFSDSRPELMPAPADVWAPFCHWGFKNLRGWCARGTIKQTNGNKWDIQDVFQRQGIFYSHKRCEL